MADEEQDLTKRQRQKQRKQAKREAEQAARRRQRLRKLAATVVVGLLALAALGAAGFFWQQSRAEQDALLSADADPAQAVGCEPAEEPADLGGQHLSQLQDAHPSSLYDHRPATSGDHLAAVAATGVYDQHVDERLLLHNLEHGYVVVWHSPELDEDERSELLQWGEGAVADEELLIVAQYPEPLPDGGREGYVAWGNRQLCDDFDPQVADAFVARMVNRDAPEIGAGPHDGSGQGELVPGEDPVVFPPLEGADVQAPEDGSGGGQDDTGGDGAGTGEGGDGGGTGGGGG